MKISIGMKSNFAFDRLCTAIQKDEVLTNSTELYPKNIQEISMLDDTLEFWKPDVLILDSKLPNFDELDDFSMDKNVEVIYFHSDYEATIEYLKEQLEEFSKKPEKKPIFQIPKRQVKTIDPESVKAVINEQPREKEIIYKEKVIEKEIYRTSYTTVPNKLIIVGSMWQGAGSTTVAMNLSRAIAKRGLKVSYIEFPTLKPYVFDYLAIPVKEEKSNQKYREHVKSILQGKPFNRQKTVWNDFDIDWYVNDSREVPVQECTYEDILKVIYSINSTITIVDVSANFNDQHIQQLLHHADDIYVCVDPDPVKVDWLSSINSAESDFQREEKKIIDYLNSVEEQEGLSFQFINTKYTKKIDNKVFWEALGKKPISFFPVVNYEDLIQMVWDSKLLYDDSRYTDIVEKALKPIILNAVPRDYYNVSSKKGNSKGSSNLLNIFKKHKGNEEVN
uniref:Uncharacterized protein n=1 Tax=Aeromonas sp. Ne-1 TaxID=1675689 RepID=A0A0H4J9H8_9GAMM|nr:hypothetical protein [Aeromonas sp. Ne-1]AKO69663.1 hypothetical protein [Aeromonas sp. Ne-1]